ncbi:MAG: SOS response-associated peptidase [Pseudomonadota bacterium]|nr:SOS response-associated peptidase [Pseudomonadota bacterium]MDP1906108.1 SOS response-associated peptidase [Pseudomonadota bacterium]MDP2353184.1 SOS response-associated peptidase [Pseudomonadota bacterium]
MCGRYAFNATPAQVTEHFSLADVATDVATFMPRFNIPPGTDIPVIRQSPEGRRVLHLLRWGLVPHWAKDAAIGNKLNNARAETVAEKPSYREAFKRRRCLIPASGFYEWKAEGKLRQPYFISLKSGELLAMAGLWETWQSPEGDLLRSCAIITTGANALMQPIHDRMPVILAPEHWQAWLTASVDQVTGLLTPYQAEAMQAWPVDRRVSKAVGDDAGVIEPLS